MREPCPCGSGKRYKACHGKRAKVRTTAYVAQPFAGLAGEGDWIALREIISAATASVRLAGQHADRAVTVATLLPMALPALVRESGEVVVGLQTPTSTGDPSADIGHALATALESDSGPVTPGPRPDGAPRLQDLVETDVPLDVTVHDDFNFWLDGEADETPDVRASMEQANAAVLPAARLSSVEAAYWCRLGDRDQVRWVMPHDEEPLLDGLARLHADGADVLGEGTRLLGTFRAHGRLVPVWDLVDGTTADEVEAPAAALAERLSEAVGRKAPLTADQRRARAGLANRQVTIR